MDTGISSTLYKDIKENDRVYFIVVVVRESCSGKVDGIQCKFCVSFWRKEKLESNRNPRLNVMSWKIPFR